MLKGMKHRLTPSSLSSSPCWTRPQRPRAGQHDGRRRERSTREHSHPSRRASGASPPAAYAAHDDRAKPSRAKIWPRLDVDLSNDTSTAFRLSSAKVALDGVVQYDRHDNLGDEKKLPVFTGAVAPGAHTVTVEIVLPRNGYGVFTYLRGYQVTLASTHTFVATDGKPSHVTAAAYEPQPMATLPFERRPQIAWR